MIGYGRHYARMKELAMIDFLLVFCRVLPS